MHLGAFRIRLGCSLMGSLIRHCRRVHVHVHVHVYSPSRQDAQPPVPWRHTVEGAIAAEFSTKYLVFPRFSRLSLSDQRPRAAAPIESGITKNEQGGTILSTRLERPAQQRCQSFYINATLFNCLGLFREMGVASLGREIRTTRRQRRRHLCGGLDHQESAAYDFEGANSESILSTSSSPAAQS